MMKYCPICKSENIIKIEIEELLNKLRNNLGNIDTSVIPSELRDLITEENLINNFSNNVPNKFICLSCGMGYVDGKDYSFYERSCPKEVSKEEFFAYLDENCEDEEFRRFVRDTAQTFEKYYIEVLESILSERRAHLGKDNNLVN